MDINEVIAVTRNVWNFKLFQIDDNPLVVNQIIMALFIFLIGLWAIARLKKGLALYLINGKRLPKSSYETITKIFYYIVFTILVVICLQIVGIPLSSFAFLGGALAIAFGFGAQNILNNFISGLIIMFERPVRIGDLVRVEGEIGTVQEIGARCSRVLRSDGVDLMVPNSKFLENTVINWTLGNDLIRSEVKVGVAYGSDIEKVKKVLLEVVKNHPKVLKEPISEVLFDDFGASSLDFTVFIWASAKSLTELRRIASEIRFQINQRFEEESIVISFPQRDVHLDVVSPIPIQMLSSNTSNKN